MPQVQDEAIKKLFETVQDPKQRQVLAGILNGKLVAEVYCDSEDIYEDREVPVLDEENQTVLYKSGKNKGQPKTTTEKVLVRPGTNGRLIARIWDDGRVEEVADENGFIWLRSSRKRFDGNYGFECWCGQDSRIAEAEVGVLTFDGRAPTREGIQTIADNLKKNPANYPIIEGEQHVDGFRIKGVA